MEEAGQEKEDKKEVALEKIEEDKKEKYRLENDQEGKVERRKRREQSMRRRLLKRKRGSWKEEKKKKKGKEGHIKEVEERRWSNKKRGGKREGGGENESNMYLKTSEKVWFWIEVLPVRLVVSISSRLISTLHSSNNSHRLFPSAATTSSPCHVFLSSARSHTVSPGEVEQILGDLQRLGAFHFILSYSTCRV